MNYIDTLNIPIFKQGGIHIKKKNRGKFTEYCNGKVTQKCIDKAKRSGTKKLVKRAVFAENSRKWKHQKGGVISYGIGGWLKGLFLTTYNTNEYPTFNSAFRQARIDGKSQFRWNGNNYTTDLKPNETLEALKQWNTKGDLAKEEFKRRALNNPQDFINFYSDTYQTHFNNKNFDALYNAGSFYKDGYTVRGTKNDLGKVIYQNLYDNGKGWNNFQIAGTMGNSYVETDGWTRLTQTGGPAKGLFMMEAPQKKAYNAWLTQNGLKDSYQNQTDFVQHLFNTKDKSLNTPWSRLNENVLNNTNKILKTKGKPVLKDVDELKSFISNLQSADEAKIYGLRSAWQHQNYTTEQAWEDWNSNDIDKTTKAFEALFERAGKPHMDRRYYISHAIDRNKFVYE